MVATERGDETRTRILREAGHLFAERGYVATSLGDILRATELTKGGVYFHFASKLELAEAVITEADERVTAVILDHVRGDRAMDRLLGMVDGAFIACCSPDMAMITSLSTELTVVEDRSGKHESPGEQWVDAVEALLVEARAAGELAADDAMTPRAQAEMLIAAFFGTRDLPGKTSEKAQYKAAYLQMARRLLGLPDEGAW